MISVLLLVALYPDATTQLLAQAENPAQNLAPWAILFNTGVSGVWLWTLLTGKTHPHSEYARVVTKLDAAEAELNRRAAEDRTTLIPALVRSTDILAKQLDRASNTPPPPGKGDNRR
jgi:hypothetical protein